MCYLCMEKVLVRARRSDHASHSASTNRTPSLRRFEAISTPTSPRPSPGMCKWPALKREPSADMSCTKQKIAIAHTRLRLFISYANTLHLKTRSLAPIPPKYYLP